MPRDAARDCSGIGIKEQLARVESVAGTWLVTPSRAETVWRPGLYRRNRARPKVVYLIQLHPTYFVSVILRIVNHKLDAGCVGGPDCKSRSGAAPSSTQDGFQV